jgi:thiol-disulfide isomerase/thioredoxin
MAERPVESKRDRKVLAREARQRQAKRAKLRTRFRSAGIAVGVVVIVALVGALLFRNGSSGVVYAGDIRAGGRLQRLELPKLEGAGRIDYKNLSNKPLVINFFASWCPNCVGEMPGFEQVHQQLADQVGFLGISQSDAASASIALAHQTGITYPTGIDRNGVFFNATGGVGMPTTIFVRPGGQIAEIWVGGLDPTSLKQLIAKDLGVNAS